MRERLVAVVGYDDAELLDIAGVTTPLHAVNRLGGRPPYRVALTTAGGRAITCGSGLVLQGQERLERLKGPLDTLIVSGGDGHEAAAGDQRLVAHVRRLAKESRRVASVCTGASVLASAGLLTGRRVTTHWAFARGLARRHPELTVDPAPIYIKDGDVYTAAGVTSALDLTLAFVGEDHGPEMARDVARMLVTYLQRPGNQAQMSMFVAPASPEHTVVRQIVDHVSAHLDGDLGAAALATLAGVSRRHLARLFAEHLGESPARFVRRVRTEAAAHLLTSTSLPLPVVARRCGLGSAETLRASFADRYGLPPSRYRTVHSSAGGGK